MRKSAAAASISQSSASRRGSPRSSSRGSAARQSAITSSVVSGSPAKLRRWRAIARASIAPEWSPAASARSVTASAVSIAASTIDVPLCPCGLELERDVGPVRSYELGRPSEQRGPGPVVLAVDRAPAGGGESRGGAVGELGVRLPELRLVSGCLLEVVADDLVALDQGVAVLVEPVGEAGVQVGTDRLGERVVGGIADQQMAEAVAVVAGELGAVGADELVAHERGEPGRDLRLLGRQRLHGAAMEDLALDRASLEHAPLGLVELVEAGCEQRLQRRRHVDLLVPGGHREHLRDEERVAGRSVGDPLAQLRRDARPRSACPRLPERAARSRSVPGQPGRRSTSSGRAMHRSSSGAPAESSAVDSTRSRNVSSPHWMSSRDHDQRRLLLEQLAERPGDLVSARPDVRLAQKRADRRCRDRIRRQRRELLHDLDHRPVGDPVPVGQTAPAHDAGLDRGERLGDQPRLAHPGVARRPSRARSAPAPARAPTRRRSARARARGRRTAPRGCAPARPAPRRAGTPAPAPTSPSASAAPPAPPPRASCTSACVGSPISTSPGAAACSNRAATFTASPVASRSAVPVTTSPVLTPMRPRCRALATRRASPPPPGRPAARRPRAPAGRRTPPSPRRR